ncbi:MULTISPECIES: EthD family reductase [Mycobacteriales]|uniref:EthD family reductase n=1 Tax=Mycobacteriales TaxID=85007 RepID=UPI000B8DBCF7|nr:MULTISPECIES: EthD family reductase [Mycobacteriales]ASR05569.1 EthD protein [Gordonia rubripertincta]
MTVRVSVCYGQPTDEDAFDKHYSEVHIPLANKIPGLLQYTYGKVSSLDKSTPAYYSVAGLVFADSEALKAGLSSPEMGAAAADVNNFATGGVTMFVTQEETVGP